MENKNKNIQAFLEEIIILYNKYSLSISHEDTHGSFIIEDYCEYNENWLRDAMIEVKKTERNKDFEELFIYRTKS